MRIMILITLMLSWGSVQTLTSDVSGLGGNIFFDVHDDGSSEMVLSGGQLGIFSTSPSANLHVEGNAIISTTLLVGGATNDSGSNLHVHGTIAMVPQVLGSGISVIGDQSFVTVDTSSGDAAVYLPSAVANAGRTLTIKRISNANYFHLSASGNLMDDYSVITFGSGNYNSIDLVSDGSNWFFFGGVGMENIEEHEYLYWKLDDSSGNTATDHTAWNRSGTLSGTNQFSGNSVVGPMGNGLKMDQFSDEISFTVNTIAADIGYTYTMWFSANVASNATMTIPSDIGGNNGFIYGHHEAGMQHSAYHLLTDGSLVTTQHASTLSANVWNHIGVTWNGSSLQLYINGTASSSNTATSWKGGSQFVAPHPGNFSSDNVRYDDIRFYTRGLSATMVQAIYNEGTP